MIDDAAAEAEADDAEFAAAVGTRLQPSRRGIEIFPHLGAVDLTEQRRALLVVSGIAAHRSEPIGRQRHETVDRQPPRHVSDVRIETAVLVDDQYHGQFLGIRRPHEVALDAAIAHG